MTDGPRGLDRGVRRLADRVGFVLLWGWILTSLFFVPTWLGYWPVGTLLFLVGAAICWGAARASTHPVYTIGTRREETVERIDDPGYDCDECGRPAGGGERRRYAKRRVLFGTTVAVPEWGATHYCEACADGSGEHAIGPDGRAEDTRELERS